MDDDDKWRMMANRWMLDGWMDGWMDGKCFNDALYGYNGVRCTKLFNRQKTPT